MISFRKMTTMDAMIDRLAVIAATEGHVNIIRLRNEFNGGVNTFSKQGECLFGAYYYNEQHHSQLNGDELIGTAGLNIDPYSTDQLTGRIRRLYVAPEFRRRGTGEKLINAIELAATGHFHILHVNTNSPSASLFYERLGYQPVPLENATHVKRLTPVNYQEPV